MNRDKHLQRLLLLHVRDGAEPPELAKYSKEQKIYNGALLIQDEYVQGDVILNSSGIPAATRMRTLTSKGHDFLDETDPKHQSFTSPPPLPIPIPAPQVAGMGLLPEATRTLLSETIGHLLGEHQREAQEAIRNLKFRLANQGISQSSAANQEGVRILGAAFDVFVVRILTDAKRVLERMSVGATAEQDIITILNAVLDSAIQADSQILLNVAEPRIGPLVVGQFQQRCQPIKAKMATEVKIFCQGLESADAPRLPRSDASEADRTSVRRTLTIIFTDIKGYSALVDQDESAALKMLEQHNAVMDPCIPAHGGKLVKRMGDSYMVWFQSALDGLRCAISMQDEFAKLNSREASQIQVRIGINTGDVHVGQDGDLQGNTVNIAKRIEGEARPGGICISESVFHSVSSSERKQFSFQDAGKLPLKGSSEPVQCWHVVKSGQRATFTIAPTIAVVDKFTPQKATANPAIFFDTARDLMGVRSEPFTVPDGARAYLRLAPVFAVPPINTELEARNLAMRGQLRPLGKVLGLNWDRNAFGALAYGPAQDGVLHCLTQLFLSRELWGIDSYALNADRIRKWLDQNGQGNFPHTYIASGYIEEFFVETLQNYLGFAESHLQLVPPLHIEAGLVGIKGYSITIDSNQVRGGSLRDNISWHEQISSYQMPAWEILSGFFDRIWDNCGFQRTAQMQDAYVKKFRDAQ